MFLAAGTQSASGKQNFLIVMKMSDLQEMEEEHSKIFILMWLYSYFLALLFLISILGLS
jgi:hypothetical protein